MKSNTWHKRASNILGVLLGSSALSYGNGFYLPVQDPYVMARGNAFVATADRPSATYYNPAGLTQLKDMQLYTGLYAIRVGIEADYAGGNYEVKDPWYFIPQIYAAIPATERLTFGIGLGAPFGLGTDWANTPLSFDSKKAIFQDMALYASAGYEISETLSLGGGLTLHRAELENSRNIGGGNSLSFEGDDVSYSWLLGLHWKPHEKHSVGLVYRSKTDYDLTGDVNITGLGTFDASLDGFLTPDTLTLGYAYKPNDKWELEANLEWVNWERLDSTTLNSTLGPITTPFEWDAAFIYALGATHQLNDKLALHFGYNFIENAQPDETFNAGVSDADRHALNAGLTWDYNEQVSLNLGYQISWGDREVEVLGQPAHFDLLFHSIQVGTQWKF